MFNDLGVIITRNEMNIFQQRWKLLCGLSDLGTCIHVHVYACMAYHYNVETWEDYLFSSR